MLSYRHSFHAGNHADVLKHLVLTSILAYLVRKDKPLCYLDTHAGAGGYALQGVQAQKNREYETGIGCLWERDDLPAPLADYVELVRRFNPGSELQYYPGSPWLARQLLRSTDRLFLHELHPADCAALREQSAGDRRVKVSCTDGYQGCIALVPPMERRGLVLIDPPFEVKSDYLRAIETLHQAYRRFATGVYALWYPVVERARVDQLEGALRATGIPGVDRYELGVARDRRGHGMTASGLLVVNPPWILRQEMEQCLPWLAGQLGQEQGHFRMDSLG
ncbi:MAG: 23S rRNA (adenine(2030)-N(6))-methyltransferase RlmJ [Gammaproteobacteria bacterium]|nr:23S rRNA (adenine(2030)-N(6))-methyltransferase RlmJ [Gammaproteobacteria bacterium]